jgi:hypothetical protein
MKVILMFYKNNTGKIWIYDDDISLWENEDIRINEFNDEDYL